MEIPPAFSEIFPGDGNWVIIYIAPYRWDSLDSIVSTWGLPSFIIDTNPDESSSRAQIRTALNRIEIFYRTPFDPKNIGYNNTYYINLKIAMSKAMKNLLQTRPFRCLVIGMGGCAILHNYIKFLLGFETEIWVVPKNGDRKELDIYTMAHPVSDADIRKSFEKVEHQFQHGRKKMFMGDDPLSFNNKDGEFLRAAIFFSIQNNQIIFAPYTPQLAPDLDQNGEVDVDSVYAYDEPTVILSHDSDLNVLGNRLKATLLSSNPTAIFFSKKLSLSFSEVPSREELFREREEFGFPPIFYDEPRRFINESNDSYEYMHEKPVFAPPKIFIPNERGIFVDYVPYFVYASEDWIRISFQALDDQGRGIPRKMLSKTIPLQSSDEEIGKFILSIIDHFTHRLP